VPKLLVAAIAESADLMVLHVDKDFELITQITGQPCWRSRNPYRVVHVIR
jgi:predicted nucleic acid-binding protein